MYRLDDRMRVKQFDFARRLVAKFEIPNTDVFWGNGFDRIPHDMLYQPDDLVKKICETF